MYLRYSANNNDRMLRLHLFKSDLIAGDERTPPAMGAKNYAGINFIDIPFIQ